MQNNTVLQDISSDGSFCVAGHEFRLLHEPAHRLKALKSLIDGAQSSIKMFNYMFRNDQTGNEVLAALIAAAKRGVAVQLIIDSFGSAETKHHFFQPLIDAGGDYHCFGSRKGLGYLVRNHQKIVIIDKERVLVGGFNISDFYYDRAGDASWEDFGTVMTGAQVQPLVDYYDALSDLSRDGAISFRKMRRLIQNWKPGDGPVRWVLGGPSNRISPWALSLKRDLETAKRADIVEAYFSPSQTILRRITRISKRGGKVRLILAGKTDNGATIGAARSLYIYLLKRGVEINEFQTKPLHMKLLAIDNACYIGSANMDVRSLFINMEIMLRIEDAAMATHIRAMMDRMAGASEHQTLAKHRKRATLLKRVQWALNYFLVNTVDYTIGRRIKFGLLRK
jgi:cardiolipin synthase A/B